MKIDATKWYVDPNTGKIEIGEAWLFQSEPPELREWDISVPVRSYISAAHAGNKTATYMPISGVVTDTEFCHKTWQSDYFETEAQVAEAWENETAFGIEHVE